MSVPDWPIIEPSRLGDTVASLKAGLVYPLQKALTDLSQMLKGGPDSGLTHRDNFRCAPITLGRAATINDPAALITSGVEFAFANPFGKRQPLFFEPKFVTTAAGASMQISDCSPINFSRADGLLGVTIGFGTGAHTGPHLIKYLAGAQSIAHNSAQVVNWDSATPYSSRGSVISGGAAADAGLFTVSEAGTYAVTTRLAFQSGVTFTAAEAIVDEMPGSIRVGDSYVSAALTDGPVLTATGTVKLPAGGQLRVRAYHTNAAVAARNLLSGSATGSRISIDRLYSDAPGIVTGILWGS